MQLPDTVPKIGGGSAGSVPVSINTRVVRLQSRGGLRNSDIRVATGGKYTGYILIPVWRKKKADPAKRYRRYQLYSDIYGAFRGQWSAVQQYGSVYYGERGGLFSARDILSRLNTAVLDIGAGDLGTLYDEFQQSVAGLLEQIGVSVRDEDKVWIVERADRLANPRDRRSVFNPGAHRAVSAAGIHHVEQRLERINRISPRMAARLNMLETIIDESEFYLYGINNFLQQQLGRAPAGRLSINAAGKSHLDFYRRALARFDIRPFISTAWYVQKEFQQARDLVERQLLADAYQLLNRSRQSLRLRQARTVLERIILKMSIPVIEKNNLLSGNLRDTIDGQTKLFIDALRTIDESGFARPVVGDVISMLGQALQHLQADMPIALFDTDVRQPYKDAAQLL